MLKHVRACLCSQGRGTENGIELLLSSVQGPIPLVGRTRVKDLYIWHFNIYCVLLAHTAIPPLDYGCPVRYYMMSKMTIVIQYQSGCSLERKSEFGTLMLMAPQAYSTQALAEKSNLQYHAGKGTQ